MPDILLIMRKPGNTHVLSQALISDGHTCTGASSSDALESVLKQGPLPDLAVIDVTGFGESVWSMCGSLQQANVPFIVLSAKQELPLSCKTLDYGATSILEKPVIKTSLLKLISGIARTPA